MVYGSGRLASQPLQFLSGIAQLSIDGYALVELFFTGKPRLNSLDLLALGGDALGQGDTLFQCEASRACRGLRRCGVRGRNFTDDGRPRRWPTLAFHQGA
ncbi:hypothetical protein D9M71_819460 [compost metagenome]